MANKTDTERIASFPPGHEVIHTTAPPNPDTVIFEGPCELEFNSNERVQVEGQLAFQWLPSPRLRFHGVEETAPAARASMWSTSAPGSTILTVPSLGLRVPVLLTDANVNLPGSTTYQGLVDKGARVGELTQPIDKLQFHLANFHRYTGRAVRWGKMGGTSRMLLRAHGWKIEIDQQPSYDAARIRELRQRGGYLVGHAGRVYRAKGGEISIKEADDIITSLHFFLSFLRGFWCGPIATVGLNAESPLWTEWRSWKLTPWKSVQSWFPRHHTVDLEDLFWEFRKRWRKPIWRQVFGMCLFWYVQANAESGSLESSIVSTFVALEMIAWAYLVDDLRLVAGRRFDDLSADEKVRRLIENIGAPTAIPSYYGALRASAKARKLRGGPAALAHVRNALVHPKKSKRRRIARWNRLAKLEVKQLALSYLELSLLHILKYEGRYMRRILTGFEDEAVTKVPWA